MISTSLTAAPSGKVVVKATIAPGPLRLHSDAHTKIVTSTVAVGGGNLPFGETGTWVETPHVEVWAVPFFESAYAGGGVEEIQADECLELRMCARSQGPGGLCVLRAHLAPMSWNGHLSSRGR
jgi:hypothetical protein